MKPFTKISSIVFALAAIIHLMRLINHFQLTIGGTDIPYWVNGIGLIISVLLSVGLWKESGSINVFSNGRR
jgi:hypothetical protein